MKLYSSFFWTLSVGMLVSACQQSSDKASTASAGQPAAAVAPKGQSAVEDNVSQKDIVKVAVGSPDHSTLVAALQAADYVDVLSNAGPFTVFAPTNAAFDKLPAGTLEELTKPEKKADLRTILEYHVYVGVLKPEMLNDGQSLGQVSGHRVQITKANGATMVNGAAILGSVPATNGIVYVIDKVLIPETQK